MVVLVVIELVLFYAITNVKFKKRDLIFALVIWLGNQLTAQLAVILWERLARLLFIIATSTKE